MLNICCLAFKRGRGHGARYLVPSPGAMDFYRARKFQTRWQVSWGERIKKGALWSSTAETSVYREGLNGRNILYTQRGFFLAPNLSQIQSFSQHPQSIPLGHDGRRKRFSLRVRVMQFWCQHLNYRLLSQKNICDSLPKRGSETLLAPLAIRLGYGAEAKKDSQRIFATTLNLIKSVLNQ